MTDSRKERKEDMTDHWWNIHTKICSLKAETENEKEKEKLFEKIDKGFIHAQLRVIGSYRQGLGLAGTKKRARVHAC